MRDAGLVACVMGVEGLCGAGWCSVEDLWWWFRWEMTAGIVGTPRRWLEWRIRFNGRANRVGVTGDGIEGGPKCCTGEVGRVSTVGDQRYGRLVKAWS